ncbi:MAG TPA: GNAT family N-acetyltransferase [Gammaproteobacteria bacterium]|nr:GNAT family N-acetyltransferase [Gammaproteobacteria bacterium]
MSPDSVFRIRAARNGDAGTILGLIKELAAYEKLSHEVVATEQGIDTQLFGSQPHAEALIAEHRDSAIGFALFFHNFSTFLGRPGLYLEDLYVKPEFRGHGYGRKLLAYLAQLAVQRGCGRLEWAVLDWNTPAIRFYESLGAKILDEWKINRLTGEALRSLAQSEDTQ